VFLHRCRSAIDTPEMIRDEDKKEKKGDMIKCKAFFVHTFKTYRQGRGARSIAPVLNVGIRWR
jgi:hypothetical protein